MWSDECFVEFFSGLFQVCKDGIDDNYIRPMSLCVLLHYVGCRPGHVCCDLDSKIFH